MSSKKFPSLFKPAVVVVLTFLNKRRGKKEEEEEDEDEEEGGGGGGGEEEEEEKCITGGHLLGAYRLPSAVRSIYMLYATKPFQQFL